MISLMSQSVVSPLNFKYVIGFLLMKPKSGAISFLCLLHESLALGFHQSFLFSSISAPFYLNHAAHTYFHQSALHLKAFHQFCFLGLIQ